MATGQYRFDRFNLDGDNRLLTADGAPVELNARYLDALVLLVREAGHLVTKNRFLEEVWRGVPVTDEALTQCIRTLRRQLGDDAAKPRFIETVPKHGYRFIAPLEAEETPSLPPASVVHTPAWQKALLIAGAGALGGGAAGGLGGLFYGFAGAAQTAGQGSTSVLAVMVCLCLATGLLGGLGVGAGIAAAGLARKEWWAAAIGGAAGGLFIGAVVKLLGLDAFNLLFGAAPDQIAGGFEGLILGGATGVAAGAIGRATPGRILVAAGIQGGLAGLFIASLGGRLMAGSLAALASQFPASRLSLQPLGKLFGETGFGVISRFGTSALEGALFAVCVVGAILLAKRKRP